MMRSFFWGYLLRALPPFQGRGRLERLWRRHRRPGDVRIATLPFGGQLPCDLSVQYEASIWLGSEEPDELALIGTLLAPGQTFVDCGANIGVWTICAGHLVKPAGRVVAFEPNPRIRGRLEEAVRLNELTSTVRIDLSALSNTPGTIWFECSDVPTMSHVVGSSANGAIQCYATTLDIAMEGAQLHGIKLDVEGHEIAVLRGAERVLRESRPWIIVEFNPGLGISSVLGEWPVHQFLRSLGYHAFPCRQASTASQMPALPDRFDATPMFKSGTKYCNLLYRVPEERVG
jgi:FkbM family methyltransferase